MQARANSLKVRLGLVDLDGELGRALLSRRQEAAQLRLALGRCGRLLLGGRDLVGLRLDVRAQALRLLLRGGDPGVQVADALRMRHRDAGGERRATGDGGRRRAQAPRAREPGDASRAVGL